jgi:hypothetical protein
VLVDGAEGGRRKVGGDEPVVGDQLDVDPRRVQIFAGLGQGKGPFCLPDSAGGLLSGKDDVCVCEEVLMLTGDPGRPELLPQSFRVQAGL